MSADEYKLRPRRVRLLARVIVVWSWIGWALDTPFRLPFVWAVDKAGIVTDEGHPNDWTDDLAKLYNGPPCVGCDGTGVAVFRPALPAKPYAAPCPACAGTGREPS